MVSWIIMGVSFWTPYNSDRFSLTSRASVAFHQAFVHDVGTSTSGTITWYSCKTGPSGLVIETSWKHRRAVYNPADHHKTPATSDILLTSDEQRPELW